MNGISETILLPIRRIASYFVEFLESVDEIFGKIWNCLTTIGGTPGVFPMQQVAKGQFFKFSKISLYRYKNETGKEELLVLLVIKVQNTAIRKNGDHLSSEDSEINSE